MLKIIYEDDDILALDKPAGLVVDRSETQQDHTLEDWLQKRHLRPNRPYLSIRGSINNIDIDSRFRGNDKLERQGIVHRLDKDTSGVILVAKTQTALENLQNQFQQRVTKKEYLALVHGVVEKPGRVEGNIGRNPGNREKFTVIEEGKEAVTEYVPEGNFQFSIFNFQSIFNGLNKIQMRKLERMKYNQFTLLYCRPKTGRTHQIRVHLKYIGFPIVADEKYVGRKTYRLDKRWCSRMFLHAAKMGFFHPKSGEWMEVESPIPDDLEKALSKLSS